ncbi:MAG: acyl-[ACP]--phospholipid O-acyltransferase [Candidatus Ozemobacteraceae bacterium]
MKATEQKPSLNGLLIAQFFGAFNDNAWKMMVALLAIRGATAGIVGSNAVFESISQSQTTLAYVVFTLPLALFSIPAGMVADRISKSSLIILLKGVEIILMAAGTASLLMDGGTFYSLIVLGLMGIQAAFFSPAKYGIIPEILPTEQLSWGNARLEMWTFLAIILGTGSGGLLLDFSGKTPAIAGCLLTMFSVAGLFASMYVPKVSAARSEGGFVQSISEAWKAIRTDRVLYLGVLGSVYFWFTASLLGQDILVYAKALTRDWANSDTFSGIPLAFYGIGVGMGSLWAGRISGHLVEYGLIPLGAIGIAFFSLLFSILGPGYFATLIIMIFLGISSGLVVVPLDAILQWRSPADRRGSIIALANVFVFTGIMFGSLGAGGMAAMGMSTQTILMLSATFTVGGTVWAIWLLPEFLIRLIFVILAQTFYRLTIVGSENVPSEGGALLVPNHVSFIDSFLVMASTHRPVRFIVDAIYYHNFWLYPLMKTMNAIPVSATGGIRMIIKALRTAGECLDQGDLVCIFAEGQITRIGMLLPFHRGLERIIKGRTAPVIPVYMDRIWGSFYSHAGGGFFAKLPERYPFPITIQFGKQLPSTTHAAEIQQNVQELGATAWQQRKADSQPLHRDIIRSLRTRPWRTAFSDATHWVTRGGVLASAIAMARRLRTEWAGQEFVGLCLPASINGALANLAATIMGKVSVNINFTSGREGMESAAQQTGLKTLVTSREFMEKAKIEFPSNLRLIYLEDVVAQIGIRPRLFGLITALFAPIPLLEWLCGADKTPAPDDLATVIFSSGSTGTPKGVMLSHYNVISNVDAVGQVLTVGHKDRLLGVLPLFHSFGYMSLWFALKCGMAIVFHANPLEAAKIGELCEYQGVTFMIATPTFLQLYMRRCAPGQFGSIRIVFTGAEKLSPQLATAFEEKFGIRPIEGYGATECAPAITVSTLDSREQGIYQIGSRRGFVGHPIPGVAVRIVDPDTFEPLPPGKSGMLLVRGPNVMRGYLGRDDLTAKALRNGWYVTGDIAQIDEDGFVKITDRLSRFSKIGGEMVPHGKVEEALHEAAGSSSQIFAVTGIPDEKKGESLAVLHTLDETRIPEILEKLAAKGLPNLFIPKKDRFLKVPAIPVLGTGKVDLRAIRQKAIEAFNPAKPG